MLGARKSRMNHERAWRPDFSTYSLAKTQMRMLRAMMAP